METKELGYSTTVNVEFVQKTKFNAVGEIKALKTGVAKKLLAAGVVKEYVPEAVQAATKKKEEKHKED